MFMVRWGVDYRFIVFKMLVFFGIIVFMLNFIIGTADAGLQVSYYSEHLNTPIGGSETRTLRVTNIGSETEVVRVFYQDWIREPNGDHRYFEGGTLERSLYDWIQITPSTFTLQPGEYQDVTYTITVPSQVQASRSLDPEKDNVSYVAVEGTYWGIIMIEPVSVPAAPGQGLGISAVFRHGVKVFVTVPNTGTLSGNVSRITVVETTPSALLMEGLETITISFVLDFENTGTIYAKTSGYFEVLNSKGELISRLNIYPESMTVMPGETLEYAAPYVGQNLSPGDYLVLGVIDYGGSSYVAGMLRFHIRTE